MRGRARSCLGALALLACLASPPAARAQDNYEIQVYGSETVAPGATMVELHSNSALRGTTRETDGVRPTEHALHETLEVTHGFTPWFETGFYLFTSLQPDGWQWVGDHLRPRVRVPAGWRWPVGVSLSTEFGYQQRQFSTDTWTLEIRPIVDQELGRAAAAAALPGGRPDPRTAVGVQLRGRLRADAPHWSPHRQADPRLPVRRPRGRPRRLSLTPPPHR